MQMFYILLYSLAAAFSLGLGILVFGRRRSWLTFFFFLLCLCITVWLFGFAEILQNVGDVKNIIFWDHFIYLGIIFFTIIIYHFSLIFTGLRKKWRLYFGYFIFFIFFLSSFTRYFVCGAYLYPWGGHLKACWLHTLFLIFFIAYAFGALNNFSQYYNITHNSLKKVQAKYIFFAFSFLFLASISFLTAYGFDIPPISNLPAVIFLIMVAYAITRYQFLDIRVVIRRSTVWLLSLFFSLILFLLGVLVACYFLHFSLNYTLLTVITFLFLLNLFFFLPILVFFQDIANKYFFSNLYSEEKVFQELVNKIPKILETEKLVSLIFQTIQNIFQTDIVGIWAIDRVQGEEKLRGLKVSSKGAGAAERLILEDKILRKYFFQLRQPFYYHELDQLLERVRNKKDFRALKRAMEDNKLEIVLPLIVKNELIGILSVGRKAYYEGYSRQDIKMLKIIANQLGGALENARLYEETKRFNLKMKEEIEKATARLRKINAQLRRLDKAKSEFISIASHQLRTPVTIIKGYISMILDGDYGQVSKEVRQALEKVYQSTQRMVNLIESLLNVTRIESGRLMFNFQKADFKKLCQETVADFLPLAKEKGISLTWESTGRIPLIKMDSAKIKEVISNLLDNSLKYTKKGFVRARLFLEKKGKKRFVVFQVQDSGMGISQKDLPNVFQKFLRGKKVSLVHTDGLGLGLYFSQKVIEAHKGKIFVESPGEGKGSTFTVKLPV